MTSALLVLHRISLDDRKTQFFSTCGVQVIKTRTVAELSLALQQPCLTRVVVDLSSGGQAPEEAMKAIHEANTPSREAPVELLGCTTHRGSTPVRRAEKLGLKTIHVWPEGAFSELVRLFNMEPQMELLRSAERATVHRTLGKGPGLLMGRIVNLSRTGAMVETQDSVDVGRMVYLLLSLRSDSPGYSIQVRVCWVEKWGPRFRVGLQFVAGLTPEDEQHIDDFVKKRNTINVESASAVAKSQPRRLRGRKVKVRALDATRVDYMYLNRTHLTPNRDVSVPYLRGQKLEVRYVDGNPGQCIVEVLGHELPRSDLENEVISLRVREVRPATRANREPEQPPTPQ